MSRIFTQPLRGSQQCPNSAQAAPRWRAKKKTVASRVRSGSSAGILSPPAPRGSAGPAQAVSRTVQSPNAYRPANAGLFLWGEWRIEKERSGSSVPFAISLRYSPLVQGGGCGTQHAAGLGDLAGLDQHRQRVGLLHVEIGHRQAPAARRAVPVAELHPAARHVIVRDRLAAVLAARDRYRDTLGHRAQPDLGAATRLGAPRDAHIDASALNREQHRHVHRSRLLARLRDRPVDLRLVATLDVYHTVDNNLRRVDGAVAAHLGVATLPRRVPRRRQRVLPPEIVPVVDRQAHGDQGGILGQLSQ